MTRDDVMGDILCCIFNHNNTAGALRWKGLLSPHWDTVVLDSGSDTPTDGFETLPNIFYGGLMKLASDRCVGGGYKWLIVVTSDVEITDDSFGRMVGSIGGVAADGRVGMYTPSIDRSSSDTYGTYTDGTGNMYSIRGINGFFSMIRRDVVEKARPMIDGIRYGWGDDVAFNYVCHTEGLKIILDCGVVVHHPAGCGYDTGGAYNECVSFLREYGLSWFREWSRDNDRRIFVLNDIKQQ